ncbi:bifunctional phosphoglucose/phosphomannose isomerase [Calditrichota bacterium GD2]
MYTLDKSDYKSILLKFHLQIEQSPQLLEKASINIDVSKVKNIVYLGLGASGLAGDLLHDVLFDCLRVPMNVIGGYFLPGYCTENTLVIASSYSGETEETVAATKKAIESDAQVLIVTSGGEMRRLAEENNLSHILLPENFRSRHVLGLLFFPLYHFLGKNGFISRYQEDLSDLAKFVKKFSARNDYPTFSGNILSRSLAYTIENKIPVIYSTAPYLRSVSRSWKDEIEQKAKALAIAGVIPEMNHNEIVGWEWNSDMIKNFIAIFLENKDVDSRILKRIEISKEIIKKRGVEVVEVYADGKSRLEKVFSLVLLGDWMSYYLALLYKKDPTEIKNVDYIRQKMSGTE